MLLVKLKDFSGYTSIHGIGRIGDSTFLLRKTFWICVCLASFSMCVYQIYRLILQFTSESVNTKLSTSYTALTFPSVTFCNLNPLSYDKMKKDEEFYQVINETAYALRLDISSFDYEVKPTTDKHSVKYTPGKDPLKTAKEVLHLRMGSRGDDTVYDLNAPLSKLLVECSYQGRICNKTTEIKRSRDEYYGACYNFTPEITHTSLAGPSFALEMLLDIAQHDYIPFVTDSAGIRMGIHNTHFKPILTSEGISISSQFETNIALKQKRFVRYPGADGSRCDENNTYSGILPCMEACIGYQVTRQCKCLSSWLYKTDTSHEMCASDNEITCMRNVQATAAEKADCQCKVPCTEITYEKNIFMTSYPAENYELVLQETMNTSSASVGSLSKSLVKVKVFFASLTEDIVEEELAYTAENFVSDMGGQLGLWAGFSVLSLAELIELVMILFHACCTAKKTDVQSNKEDTS